MARVVVGGILVTHRIAPFRRIPVSPSRQASAIGGRGLPARHEADGLFRTNRLFGAGHARSRHARGRDARACRIGAVRESRRAARAAARHRDPGDLRQDRGAAARRLVLRAERAARLGAGRNGIRRAAAVGRRDARRTRRRGAGQSSRAAGDAGGPAVAGRRRLRRQPGAAGPAGGGPALPCAVPCLAGDARRRPLALQRMDRSGHALQLRLHRRTRRRGAARGQVRRASGRSGVAVRPESRRAAPRRRSPPGAARPHAGRTRAPRARRGG